VVTPNGVDHTRYLGDSAEQIAVEKAGIIKPGSTVVSAVQADDVAAVIAERAAEVGATVLWEGRDFGVGHRVPAVGGQMVRLRGVRAEYDEVFLPLHGAHQAQNAAVALATAEAFLGASANTRQLDPEVVREGFAGATSPGRLERVRTAPTMLLDAAHNPHGMTATVKALTEEFPFNRLVVVLATLADKDVTGMLELLEPITEAVVCTRNTSPRAMPAERLGDLAAEVFGEERIRVEPFLPDAIETAVAIAESDVEGGYAGVGILITGSVITVADARALLVR
jgi:dihydrofolate synthase/folylpolyglutamate synthase